MKGQPLGEVKAFLLNGFPAIESCCDLEEIESAAQLEEMARQDAFNVKKTIKRPRIAAAIRLGRTKKVVYLSKETIRKEYGVRPAGSTDIERVLDSLILQEQTIIQLSEATGIGRGSVGTALKRLRDNRPDCIITDENTLPVKWRIPAQAHFPSDVTRTRAGIFVAYKAAGKPALRAADKAAGKLVKKVPAFVTEVLPVEAVVKKIAEALPELKLTVSISGSIEILFGLKA